MDATAKGGEMDEESFREFAAAAMPRLRRVAIATSGDVHRADDLVQTTLEKVYVAWPRIHRTSANPYGYARRTLVNALLAEQRRPWWRREVSRDDAGERAATADPTDAVADQVTVLAALRELPPRQRMAVALRHLEGLSVAETAQAMGCSEGTVKSTTSDGLVSLRAILSAEPAGGCYV